MLSLMTSVYNALVSGVACTVTRAWPQRPPLTPSLAFRLADFRHQTDGSDLAEFEVFIRCVSPEQGDTLADQAVSVFLSLLFNLSAASDEIEEETGVFLKRLRFKAELLTAQVAPLILRVNIVSTPYIVGGQLIYELTPDARRLLDNNAISAPAVRFVPGGLVPGGLTVRGDYLPADNGQIYVKNAFQDATLVKASLSRAAFILPFDAYVTECSHTPLGFFAVFRNVL